MTQQFLEERLSEFAFEQEDVVVEALRKMVFKLPESDIQKMDVKDLSRLLHEARMQHPSVIQLERLSFLNESLRCNS